MTCTCSYTHIIGPVIDIPISSSRSVTRYDSIKISPDDLITPSEAAHDAFHGGPAFVESGAGNRSGAACAGNVDIGDLASTLSRQMTPEPHEREFAGILAE